MRFPLTAPSLPPPNSGINILTFPVDEEMHASISFDLSASDKQLIQREIFGERRDYAYYGPLQAEIFINLTRLYVSESVFDPVLLPTPVPPFPSLLHLLIWPMPDH